MIQVSEETHRKLKYYCVQNDKKMTKVIERLVDNYANLEKLPKNVLKVQ